MRAFRVGAGAVLAVVGLVVFVAGAVTAFWIVGPDDVLSLRPHSFRGDVVAVTSRPDLLDYYGSRVVVSVEPARKDQAVFVGVGHDIDVRSYLDKAPQTRLSKVGYPSTVGTTEAPGTQARVLPPAALDWWVAKVGGSGRQTLRWKLADGPYDLVIMRADGDAGLDVTATFGLEVKGAFASSLLVLAAGAVLLAGGVLLTGWVRRRPRFDGDDGELDWEGRELWAQNEYWTSSEQPTRTGGVLVPGDIAPTERPPDNQPARIISTQGEDPPWQINGVPSAPGGPGEPMRSGGQRVYASEPNPVRPSSPPRPSPRPSPPHRSPPHVSPPQVAPHPGTSAPDSFTAPGPGGPSGPNPDPTRTDNPPAWPPWRPAGAPPRPARRGPATGPRHADGPKGPDPGAPQSPAPRIGRSEPDLSDFPSFDADEGEPPPWLPGPVGQPFTLPPDPPTPGERAVQFRRTDGGDPTDGPSR